MKNRFALRFLILPMLLALAPVAFATPWHVDATTAMTVGLSAQ